MASILEAVQWVLANYQVVVSYLITALTAIIAVCLMIPGEQPEKFLQGVVDFLGKYSKK